MAVPLLMEGNRNERVFRKIGIVTISAVYLLILVGGIVRSTGSGMGCPDWPKCFGQWVPPTDISQLPADYKEIYANKRKIKNQKLGSMLAFMGFEATAGKIMNDESIYRELTFNSTKTRIEYFNRLLGVIIGFLIFLLFIYSIPFLKSDKAIFYLSLFSVILVGFQGWLGSIVVSTNLLPFVVTLHMALALILVVLLIYIVARSQKNSIFIESGQSRIFIKYLISGLAFFTFIQILIGTQVREEVDVIASYFNYQNKGLWVDELSGVFDFHRFFSFIILGGHILYIFKVGKSISEKGIIFRSSLFLLIVVAAEIVFGISTAKYDFPAFIQPIHLVLGTIIFGLQFFILMALNFGKELKPVKI
jgi:heme a synthase